MILWMCIINEENNQQKKTHNLSISVHRVLDTLNELTAMSEWWKVNSIIIFENWIIRYLRLIIDNKTGSNYTYRTFIAKVFNFLSTNKNELQTFLMPFKLFSYTWRKQKWKIKINHFKVKNSYFVAWINFLFKTDSNNWKCIVCKLVRK